MTEYKFGQHLQAATELILKHGPDHEVAKKYIELIRVNHPEEAELAEMARKLASGLKSREAASEKQETLKPGDVVAYRTKDSHSYQHIVAQVIRVGEETVAIKTLLGRACLLIPAHVLTKIKTVWADSMKLVEGGA